MARNQGIGSPFPRQLSARSRKLVIYETLFLLNENVDRVIEVLRGMEKLPSADKESIRCAIVEIDEVRCALNADFIECQADNERFDQGRFWKKRREFEKKLHDPDDVYLDVQRREGERKKQGLPPRLGVLAHSAAAELEQSREAGQERKKKRPNKRGK
jgi:hypothetical protein